MLHLWPTIVRASGFVRFVTNAFIFLTSIPGKALDSHLVVSLFSQVKFAMTSILSDSISLESFIQSRFVQLKFSASDLN